ncbi:hypothetical protein DB347_01775 [Opitutaceae bacterium EW11]|nr:hypothetical protein DB347_01775 [Opitutaceae bacterium EW11]
MRVLPLRVVFPGLLLGLAALSAQTPGASRLTPNLAGGIDRPLRYRPDGADFVIEDGKETFNRPLYGGNSAFRVDGGDRPEFVLYLPGRGGNVRVGVATPAGAKWLIEAASIQTRYRPGELIYDIRDPLLGPDGRITLTAVAYRETEGLALSVAASGLPGPVDLVWAFGGVNGQRGTRDGDIGTEKVPISEWFQLKPAFCRGNVFELRDSGFTLRAKAATLVGVTSVPARQAVADAADWGSPAKLLRALEERPHSAAAPELPVVVGLLPLTQRRPVLLSFQRVTSGGAEELPVYREVTKPGTAQASAPKPGTLAPVFAPAELTSRFAAAEEQFSELRNRVRVQTPDPYLNAAVGALNVAADAVWDEPQQAIMHGAIAWRTKLLGWRGPYSLDALGRHDRARKNMLYWIGRQNTDTVPGSVPPADEAANLARNEAGLHSNGDLSNSHYDMNLVFFDGVFRHLRWTGDLKLARRLWPAIVRHLAWERRLFRREYGPEKLPLYEAYAAIWASDDLQYGGGGTAHASAYNYFQNREAARLARLLGENPEPYEREAELIGRAMRKLLWLPDRQCFAEYKDWLGLQRVHPSAALWTFYHTVDSEVPTGDEAWRMSRQVDDEIPHLPVRGPGVPDGFYTLSTSDWMPYQWSINNVVMSEVMHASLGFWQAGRPDEAWRMAKGSLLAAMYLGISPGNVGSMSYLDVYRRESQRDFADGCGTFSRALIEGLFGLRPDALSGVLTVSPGFPEAWPQASLVHPDVSFTFWREGDTDTYDVEQRFPVPQALRLIVNAPNDRVGDITINGVPGTFAEVPDAIGGPKIEIRAQPAGRHRVAIRWAGVPVARGSEPRPAAAGDGRLAWRAEPRVDARLPEPDFPRIQLGATDRCEPVDLSGAFNDRVTQIFRNEYRSPRSPFVSLALPKQGLGGWAGGVKTTAEIDDSGLRASAARGGGRISLPNGVPLATPGEPQARNVAFVSQWDNYPKSVSVELSGRARGIVLLMAGSTGPMQSRFENGEVVVRYADGSADRLSLQNPVTWWPIEQDYFVDDFQFRRPQPLPMRVDLKTGNVRVLSFPDFEGRGGPIPGGAATVLELPLQPDRELRSLEVRALANDVVIGLMSATLVR